MGPVRALLRLAVRDVRRDRWRSLLVVGLIALPVGGILAVITLADAATPTSTERARSLLGAADLRADLVGDAQDPVADLTARLPAGAAIEPIVVSGDEVVLPGRRLGLILSDHSLLPGALAEGMRELVAGRAPREPGEIALSPALAERLGAEIGDEVRLDRLGRVVVVGIARDRERLSAEHALAAPGTLDEAPGVALAALPAGARDVLADPGLVAQGLAFGPEAVWSVAPREEVLASRLTSGQRQVVVVVGGLAAVEVALIAGAAFAVSVRRRQRELGLLAAVGGSPRHTRAAVLLTGAATGAFGALVGVLLAFAGILAAVPWLDGILDRVVGVPVLDLRWAAGCVGVGVGAALLAAWLPARTTARLPVTVALSGRRPVPTPPRRAMVVGLAGVAAGVAVGLLGAAVAPRSPGYFLVGAVLIVLGAGLTSPWLLELLGRAAPRLPVGARLAVRDAARFRTRNGPIVTAAMAALAGTVTVTALMTSLEADERARYQPRVPDQTLLVLGEDAEAAAVRLAAELGTEAHRLPAPEGITVEYDAPFAARVGVVTPAVAEVLGGPAARRAVADGAIVLLTEEPVEEVILHRFDVQDDGSARQAGSERLGAVSVPSRSGHEHGWSFLPGILLPPSVLDGADDPEWVEYLLVLDAALDDAVFADLAETAAQVAPGVLVIREEGYTASMRNARLLVIAVGAAAGLLAVGIAVALASAESRHDTTVLTAVGAGPRSMRGFAAGRALVLSGLGGALAVPVGLLPALMLLWTEGREIPLAMPWATLALVALAVPAIAALGAAAGRVRRFSCASPARAV